ncbi:class I SAM-dependent methyltransferase [Niveispirillum sp.]|uniref:class I SAM-dependent methyltransferase n=1 Tax=Niveispirillum sp. TaxID=1917217 RepID=UPI001B63C21D|nr:class I SAM-dependent methyltransferase [Niveispirillum sp.]MBP7334576.1 methyltransferase domain-containing protein [Niveispirillum sp.]
MTQPRDSQHDLVVQQFGPRAAAYASSPTHAAGPDLAAFQAILRAAPVGSLLDLGCGGGHASFHAAPHAGEVVAYDLSADMLGTVATGAAARGLTNIRTQQGRAEQVPFTDDHFDMVASRYSAHHWRQVPVALAEAARVLRPGGRLVMMDVLAPADPLLDSFLQTVEMVRDPSHVRDYSLSEWRDMLSAAGMTPQGPAETYRLRLEFQPWVDRIGSPESHRPALRSLLAGAAAEVKQHFAVEADGSFTIDTMLMVAVKES